MRIALLAPITPARDSPSRTSGSDACRSSSRRRVKSSIRALLCRSVASDSFSRFVSLACHDLRTPLATVSGFAHTLDGMDEIGQPAGRYVAIMRSAGEQMGELLDALGLVARIEGGRYEPALVEADSLELAEAAAAKLGERASAAGSGGRVRVDVDPI